MHDSLSVKEDFRSKNMQSSLKTMELQTSTSATLTLQVAILSSGGEQNSAC